MRSTATRSIPTRGRCCPPGRQWIRAGAPRRRRSRAIRPTRSIHRRAAASARVAHSPRISARAPNPCWRRRLRNRWPATSGSAARAIRGHPEMTELLQVQDLNVTFVTPDRTVHAVNGVSFGVKRGETLGILGESGSGKSVTLRSILKLHPEHRTRWSGSIKLEGDEILSMTGSTLADLRGNRVAMIFQEPATAFDPVFTIGHQIAETVRRHTGKGEADAMKRARELLEMVRIPSPVQRLKAYPHEMSGGMRQRAMIALALSCNPSLLLADEPTTALDATVQIQVLLLIRELQRELDLGVIFVTHDIGVAIEVSDRVGVMYAGKLVELAGVEQMVDEPKHPYSQGLLASTVHDGMRGQRLEAIPGAPPDLGEVPTGCSFAPRCKFVRPACTSRPPPLNPAGESHLVRCVLAA